MSASIVSVLTGGHHDAINALTLSDRNLASGSDDCTVCLWSPFQSHSPVNKISLENPVSSLDFACNKPDLIYASHGGFICSYDLRNISVPLYNIRVSNEEINSIHLLESEARIAAGDDAGAIIIASSDTGQVMRTLKKHDNICSAVHFRPNRTWQIMSGGMDCRLVVSDWKESGRAVGIFEMSELLDFPEEEGLSEDDDNEELEEFEEDEGAESESNHSSAVHRTSYSSNWSDASENNPWQASSAEEVEEPDSIVRQNMDAAIETESGNETSEDEEEEEQEATRVSRPQHQVRIHSSQTDSNAYVASAMSTGFAGAASSMPINPPMIHSLAVSQSGHLVAAGLASSSVELFLGSGKHLLHSESLYGHSRGVSALQILQEDQFLVSGGNDKCVFVWPLSSPTEGGDSPNGISEGSQISHTHKIGALAGIELAKTYLSDSRPIVHMIDLSLC